MFQNERIQFTDTRSPMNPKQNKENENHTQRPTTGKLQNKTKKIFEAAITKKREITLMCDNQNDRRSY